MGRAGNVNELDVIQTFERLVEGSFEIVGIRGTRPQHGGLWVGPNDRPAPRLSGLECPAMAAILFLYAVAVISSLDLKEPSVEIIIDRLKPVALC
jgi:hypothetical protein